MAFHLGCLRALNDLEILQKVGVISTISGGSVIGAYYAYTPSKTFEQFETDIRSFLRTGFHRQIFGELLNPRHFMPGLASCLLAHVQDSLSLLTKCGPRVPRFQSRTDAFERVLKRHLFQNIVMTAPRRGDLNVVVGACDLCSGTAFRFGSERSGNWRLGEVAETDIPVSFAVAASAAYPIFLPAFDRTFRFKKGTEYRDVRISLTDGGVYDNLGIQVLEPGRDPSFSIHTFPCEYIIACNAGQGQEAGVAVPLGFGVRVKRAFEIVHRRVQDNAMHYLHGLKGSDRLRGFAMPYLGQQDASLPWQPSALVPRHEVVRYPTDFAAMSEAWIETLSNRGEQLTRVLVSCYLSDLLC